MGHLAEWPMVAVLAISVAWSTKMKNRVGLNDGGHHHQQSAALMYQSHGHVIPLDIRQSSSTETISFIMVTKEDEQCQLLDEIPPTCPPS